MVWQLLFLVLGTTWLWAPQLNHQLSHHGTLISQYEIASQPYAWLFRLGDMLAAFLLVPVVVYFMKQGNRVAAWLLAISALGLFLDPLLNTSCHIHAHTCEEYFSWQFVYHAIETTMTNSALFLLSAFDVYKRRRITSAIFLVFQVAYFLFFVTQYASAHHFNTLSQYVYQTAIIVWLAWFCCDYGAQPRQYVKSTETTIVRQVAAAWALLNGILAVLLSFSHVVLLPNRIRGLYFAGDNTWIAQHSIVIGVVMLYLSRHLARGEVRARQIFLAIVGIEVLKYAVIVPHAWLLLLYFATFCLLFIFRDDFDRGALPMKLRVRLKEAAFLGGTLVLITLIIIGILYKTNEISDLTHVSFSNFFTSTVPSHIETRAHIRGAIIARTFSAFIAASIVAMLWVLFRPRKLTPKPHVDYQKIKLLLNKYSQSSEDFFKLWPRDKQFFWSPNKTGFIGYKIVGSIAFALADPITAPNQKGRMVEDFVKWARARRLTVCFLPIYQQKALRMYEARKLQTMQVGSVAMIDIDKFLEQTVRDKWWRWQKNRATKSGYTYQISKPPHAAEFLKELRLVSGAWLETGGHEERGFALGYFDTSYLQECTIHYLCDTSGQLVAFTNQLPVMGSAAAVTVDLLRYSPDARNAMPYLLASTIATVHEEENVPFFDLGFVPFAATDEPLVRIARTLAGDRFSAAGLEQFKNKFDPEWQPTYLAYDGDLADFARIAISLERAMEVK